MYNITSKKASEFIADEEIISSIRYAEENSSSSDLIDQILDKAEQMKGITHREAALLLLSQSKEVEQRIFDLARRIKERIYGNRIVLFAPLYLSNYCVNGCVYCPYHAKNRTIPRHQRSQDQDRKSVV